jgi:hypothetical protein
LVHCALHTQKPEPAESFRITLHDHKSFYEQERLARAAAELDSPVVADTELAPAS